MGERNRASAATPAQRLYVDGLLDERVVPRDLRERIAAAEPLTDGDCRKFIPLLNQCTKKRLPRPVGAEDALPVDWGDENGGYRSPDHPSGYEPW